MKEPEELEINCALPYIAHVKIVKTRGRISSNQMGRFPITSSRDCKYIMVQHDWEINAILSELLK